MNRSRSFVLICCLSILATLTAIHPPAIAQVADGDQDLKYWRYEDEDALEDVFAVFEMDTGVVVALVPSHLSVFEFGGSHWHLVGSGDIDLPCDVSQGPDGKIWLRRKEADRLVYWDADASFHRSSSPGPDGFLVEVESWRSTVFLVLGVYGMSPCAGVYAYPYSGGSYYGSRAGYICASSEEYRAITGCAVSGDFVAMASLGDCSILNLQDFESWVLPEHKWGGTGFKSLVGYNSYFWLETYYPDSGQKSLFQLDALNQYAESIPWLEGKTVDALALGWHGLWAVSGGTAHGGEGPLCAAFWSFQSEFPDAVVVFPDDVGQSGEYSFFGGGYPREREMLATGSGELWFATDKAVCRWTPENIPMPYEARVQAEANEGGLIGIGIEFDNRRIIRNDATLRLDIEFFTDGQDEPLPGTLTFDIYNEFQPQETFTYSFEHTHEPPSGGDKARYSVYTTYIDVNAPPADEEIITSNVATAEVGLD